MHSEGHLPEAVLPSGCQGGLHQRPAEASTLVLRLQRNAQLRRCVIDIRQALTAEEQTHPARAGGLTINDCDHAYVCRLSPILNIDTNARIVQHGEWSQWCGRRVPQGNM